MQQEADLGGYYVCFEIAVNRLKSIDAVDTDNQVPSYSSYRRFKDNCRLIDYLEMFLN